MSQNSKKLTPNQEGVAGRQVGTRYQVTVLKERWSRATLLPLPSSSSADCRLQGVEDGLTLGRGRKLERQQGETPEKPHTPLENTRSPVSPAAWFSVEGGGS